MKTYTLSDLAKYVEEQESELAYGSETTNLTAFVNEYGFVENCLDSDKPISESTYNEWVNAYDAIRDEYTS